MSSRVERIEELKLLLAEREYTTAADLAADLGVSLRTLHRDLATLREMGVPIRGLSGRGGGVHLERGWSLGRVHLNELQAIGLLLSLAIAERTGSPMLLDDVRSIERKLVQAFAPSQAATIRSLRPRVLVAQPASWAVASGHRRTPASITRPLLEAFMRQLSVRIRYTASDGETSVREIEPHYLFFSQPVWYVLAWDRLRDDHRSFRIDRIQRIDVGTDRFRLRPSEELLGPVELDARTI